MRHRHSFERLGPNHRRLAAWAWAGALVLGAPMAAAAEGPNLLTDDFGFAIGAYLVQTEPTVRLDGETGTGTDVDFDEVLGGGDSSRVRIDGFWRMSENDKHVLRLMAFNFSRENSRVIDQDIQWGDYHFAADGTVDAEFSFDVIELAYEYEFLKRDNYEIGASFGVHYAGASATLSGEATVTDGNGEETVAGDVTREGSVDLPLPVLGLRGLWRLPANFWIEAQAQYFGLSIDEYDGNIQDYRVLLTWQPSKWVGLGLGYDLFKVDVDVEKDKFNGSLNWQYDGPMLFYSIAF
jgi:hypothetical protein